MRRAVGGFRPFLTRIMSNRSVVAAKARGRLRFLLPLSAYLRDRGISDPVGFNEKVRFKMAHDERPLLTTFADKLEAKEYVRRRVGPEHVPLTLVEADSAHGLPWKDLPEEFAAKVNHGSGACVVSWKGAQPSSRVPEADLTNVWFRSSVRPSAADPAAIAAFLDMHLGLSYVWMFGERAYRGIRPRAFVEEFLPGEAGQAPVDYRMYCFGGRCEVALVISFQVENPNPTGPRFRADFFSRNWVHLDGMRPDSTHHEPTPARPNDLDQMIAISDELSAETDFLRVDLIRSEGRVLVSELTNYPNAGRIPAIPDSFERWLGDFWELPPDYSTLPQGIYPLPSPEPAT